MLVEFDNKERHRSNAAFPNLGRFVEADPIGYEGGINIYAYVGNDPVNWTDPLGLKSGECSSQADVCGPPKEPGSDCGIVCFGGFDFGFNLVIPLPNGLWECGDLGCEYRPDVTVPGKREEKKEERKLKPCSIGSLSSQLAAFGFPSSHLPEVRFVRGIDSRASWASRKAFRSKGNRAVTQGNIIFVHSEHWKEFTSFTSTGGFEEIGHTAQFSLLGPPQFNYSYGMSTAMAAISGADVYEGNLLEVHAKAFASSAFSALGGMCK